MQRAPWDLDASRAEVARRGLVTEASGHLTSEVAVHLPFEALGPFKTLLKRFFSTESWGEEEVEALDALVMPHVPAGGWDHDLDEDLHMMHGVLHGGYRLWVTGAAAAAGSSPFDRVFEGPVVPEPTPHPRKVKFAIGGSPSPGVWYVRSDGEATDPRVRRLFEEPDVSDVMVAGDFVTIGLERHSSWEDRLDELLDLVTGLFDVRIQAAVPARTRDELLAEGQRASGDARPEELHLLDPDDDGHRSRLLAALDSADARTRRVAVAVLAESSEDDLRRSALRRGWADGSRLVRRTAIDSAADTEDEALRDLFEEALADDDAWTRWKAVRSLGELGPQPSRGALEPLERDPDFQVRFEAARVLRRGPRSHT